ncbi:hypothetical protein APHAL10511_000627 [Amanita phalloides]|nr:hypothetical protein APHAL10511_000627 [Amanita phalloides]
MTGTSKIHLFFGQKTLIPIKEMFDWSVEARWDEFWGPGVKHHAEEMVFYDLLIQASSEEGQDKSSGIAGTS